MTTLEFIFLIAVLLVTCYFFVNENKMSKNEKSNQIHIIFGNKYHILW